MIHVVITTYNPYFEAPRFKYLETTLVALHGLLRAGEPLHFILVDDGSPDTEPLLRLSAQYNATVVTGPHAGIGASLNRALDIVGDGVWMYTTDDWLLNEPMDLDFPNWLLHEMNYDLVRLGPIHPNLSATVKFTAGRGWWLDLEIPYRGGFYFGTRPFLAGGSLVAKVGRFDEGVDAYETEKLYNERCLEHWDLNFAAINLAGPWQHIGEYEVGDQPV